MVQKSQATGSTRGRPPAFDRDDVLISALGAFFATGYEGTTLADLERATGVDRSTLYNSFGGKAGLFRSVAARYLDRAEAGAFQILFHGTRGLADVLAVLAVIERGQSIDSLRGCLIVNDMPSPTEQSATQRYLEMIESGFRTALQRAADSGEIEAETVDRRSRMLAATVVGSILTARSTGDGRGSEMLAAAQEEVRSWSLGSVPAVVGAEEVVRWPNPDIAPGLGD